MATASSNLWQIVNALTSKLPLSADSVGSALGIRLVETLDTGNDSLRVWRGDGGRLADAGEVQAELRVKRDDSASGFLVLTLVGNCVSLGDVRKYYPTLQITQTPRGRSAFEVTAYTAKLPWGDLNFGFLESRPECLSVVSFDPRS